MKNLLIAISFLLVIMGFTPENNINVAPGNTKTLCAEPTLTVSNITTSSATITLSYFDGYTNIWWGKYGENFPNSIEKLKSTIVNLDSLDSDSEYTVVVMTGTTMSWESAPKLTFRTKMNIHCFANINGVMKICVGTCPSTLYNCQMPVMTVDVLYPKFKLTKSGYLIPTGKVDPGFCITPNGVKQSIPLAHPGVVY